jgi:hypothetical protein
MKDVDLSVLVENNLWDNTNVEFPEYCRPSWSKAEEAQVALTGAKMLPCWKTAGKDLEASFIDLPFLNAE